MGFDIDGRIESCQLLLLDRVNMFFYRYLIKYCFTDFKVILG